MGWTVNGLRPNRTRRLRGPGGIIVKRREPVRIVGTLTRTQAFVARNETGGWRRATFSMSHTLRATKGYLKASPLTRMVEHSRAKHPPKDWQRGQHNTDSFKRSPVP